MIIKRSNTHHSHRLRSQDLRHVESCVEGNVGENIEDGHKSHADDDRLWQDDDDDDDDKYIMIQCLFVCL